jgi:sulfite reductase alpha subunit-like flavoprotein
VLDTTTLLQLTPPKYKVSLLPAPPTDQQQAQLTPQQREQLLIEQAVAAAAAFRAVAGEASGSSTHDTAATPGSSTVNGQQYGPWRPFMAPVLVNHRVTSVDHFQETRYIEFDLAGSNLQYQPGDLLAIFPRTPAADVEVSVYTQHKTLVYIEHAT